jgi:predicted amidohydrolase
MQQLHALLVQASLKWQRPADNRAHLDELLAGQSGPTGLVVLPETFTTGFLGDEGEAETMNGPTVAWMQAWAERLDAVITGSVVIGDGGRYNRLLWVEPGGQVRHYDKRHLFAPGGEDRRYSAGTERRVFNYRGWRVCPQVCYDIRFPVWCRSRGDYDLLLVVANWPSARAGAWRSLLQARAIENQCYVVAVNRVGEDGHGKRYPGGSVVFDPMGEALLELGDSEGLGAQALGLERVAAVREQLPFQRDADDFELKD